MELYENNKNAKVGSQIECPVCHKIFKKIQYSQAFCCSHCKDAYHNSKDGDRHSDPNYYDNYNRKHFRDAFFFCHHSFDTEWRSQDENYGDYYDEYGDNDY